MQRFLVLYAEARANGDGACAVEIQQELCCHPHASLLSVLVELLETPGGALFVDPRCASVLASHPEIRSWP